MYIIFLVNLPHIKVIMNNFNRMTIFQNISNIIYRVIIIPDNINKDTDKWCCRIFIINNSRKTNNSTPVKTFNNVNNSILFNRNVESRDTNTSMRSGMRSGTSMRSGMRSGTSMRSGMRSACRLELAHLSRKELRVIIFFMHIDFRYKLTSIFLN